MLTANYFDIEHQYQNLSDYHKLVILHPAAYSIHRLFCKNLLSHGRAVYINVSLNDHTPSSILETVVTSLDEQLSLQVSIESDDAEIIATALASALNNTPNTLVFIDNYDPNMVLLTDILVALVPQLADGQRIILCGRVFPRIFIQKFAEERIVAVVPTDNDRLLIDYADPKTSNKVLEIHAFGQGAVLVNGTLITEWEGVLPRALFFYFIDRAMATRDEIFKTFWPQLGKNEATNVFHVTKRKISEILKIHPTIYSSGFYRISPDIQLYYDVINFREAVQNAVVVNDDEAEKIFRVAIDLYQDDFLSTLNHDWVLKRRDELRNSYTDALLGLARIYERQENKPEALGFFQRALSTAPLREDLVRSIMSTHAELGHLEYAQETYHRLAEQLQVEFNVMPDPLTIELLKKLTGKS